jgi:hypothetical protein
MPLLRIASPTGFSVRYTHAVSMARYPVLRAVRVASRRAGRCDLTASHVPKHIVGMEWPEDSLNDSGKGIVQEREDQVNVNKIGQCMKGG